MKYLIFFRSDRVERPVARPTRRGVQMSYAWREGFARIDNDGQRLYPSVTRTEAVHEARQSGAQAVFYDTIEEARQKLAILKQRELEKARCAHATD